MTVAQMLALIDKIPGGAGWWHEDGKNTFRALGQELVNRGYDPEEALGFLERAWVAVAGEYGS